MIAQFIPTVNNEVREDVFLTFNFRDKKVFDFILIKNRDSEGNRIYFVIFLTNTNDLYLIKHYKGTQKVYTDADLVTTITVSNPLTHIRGYFRNIKNVTEPEEGIVIIERQSSDGAQFMRRYIVSHDADYNPSIALAGAPQSLGNGQVGQLEVDNKLILLSIPSQGKL